MPNHYSAVYHLDVFGRIPPGRLVDVEDHDGAWADIYFHRWHARPQLVWDFNRITGHQVGSGLWQQSWTHDGRMQEPVEGLGVAISGWEHVRPGEMPSGRRVFPLEQDGSCIWLIRDDCCTAELVDEMNQMLQRIAGDGLWLQYWYPYGRNPRVAAVPPEIPVLV